VDQALRLLRETDLFAGIDGAAAEALAARLVRKRFRRRQALFQQGDPGDALYVLVDGAVEVFLTSEAGDRMVLTTLTAPEVFGEISLLDGGVRSAGCEAIDDTTVFLLSRATFLDHLREHPAFAEQLLRGLGGLVRRLSEQASDFVFLDLPGRLAKVLLRLAADTGPEVEGVPLEIAVTQRRLAEMAGGSRQSVNQILQTFAERGVIELHARKIVICDPDHLRRRAGQ
jgi:CRP-like cAMP-binding protein